MAAGMATLDELEVSGRFEGLLANTRDLAAGFERSFEQHRVRARVPRVGTVFSILFLDGVIRNYRDTLRDDGNKRRALDVALLERGIFVKPAKPFYLSTAHDEAAIRQTTETLDDALQAA